MYGLRRQALIVKRARHHGVEELLPYSTKLSWVKTEKREAQGLRVKGTGVGQKVKGKEWERTQKGRLEKRRTAMLKMPEMIQQWKEVSNSSTLCSGYALLVTLLTLFVERAWSWMEEVAEIVLLSSFEKKISKLEAGHIIVRV